MEAGREMGGDMRVDKCVEDIMKEHGVARNTVDAIIRRYGCISPRAFLPPFDGSRSEQALMSYLLAVTHTSITSDDPPVSPPVLNRLLDPESRKPSTPVGPP